MYTPDDRTDNDVDPVDLGPSPQLVGPELIDSIVFGGMETPGEFEDDLYARCARHSAPMVGVCAERRAAGRRIAFGPEADDLVDVLALENGLTQHALVIA